MLGAVGGWSARAGGERLPDGRWFLRAALVAGPAAFVAIEAGWIVTEVGRQPWIVQGVMRTAEAVTTRPGIVWHLAGTIAVYVLLAARRRAAAAPGPQRPGRAEPSRGSRAV